MGVNLKTSQETAITASGVDEALDIIRGARGSVSNWKMLLTDLFTYIQTKLGLATVATTGNYNDLINKPNLQNVPSLGQVYALQSGAALN